MSKQVVHEIVKEVAVDKSEAELFRETFAAQAAGVAIITASCQDGQPAGLTISSLSSVSADPPMVAFSFQNRSGSAAKIAEAPSFLIHLVSGENVGLAQRFAISKYPKFADPSSWDRLPTGEPLLHGIGRVFRVEPVSVVEADPALVYLARVTDFVRHDLEATPVVYHARKFHQLGDNYEI
ncbi:MAG: flavin reductase family protein [Rothia sp. (in: high G+C Gram-positive bacteria)]|nr:flavin reductase family protein [Rothia sp. (in: high G+C Gram-positive bacteria)]